ncbi:MAG: diphthine--ammonia ligase [Dehalococcoidales bacterium]|nr:diphthine--ammonia ligase [Dehalococcoidales bacterium]
MEKAFISWSGGKDCCQAAYLAKKQGFDIRYLLNMVTNDGRRSCSHGLASEWIRFQSQAMGIPVLQKFTAGDNYESVFTGSLVRLREEGITTGIFGDIDFNAHREWIERVCGNAGVKPVLPLWQCKHEQVARDFINAGFEAVVVATRSDLLGKEWLGRRFDEALLKDLAGFNSSISVCGEAGEFHTLVLDGPLFIRRMNIAEAGQEKRNDHWFLDIKKIELAEKEKRED